MLKAGAKYSVTATAWNEYGESEPSEADEYWTPAGPDPPEIDFVEVLPPSDREPFGSLAITINDPITDETGQSGALALFAFYCTGRAC